MLISRVSPDGDNSRRYKLFRTGLALAIKISPIHISGDIVWYLIIVNLISAMHDTTSLQIPPVPFRNTMLVNMYV